VYQPSNLSIFGGQGLLIVLLVITVALFTGLELLGMALELTPAEGLPPFG